jgi:hypothetical protein
MSISRGPWRLTATLALAILLLVSASLPGSAAPAADPSPPRAPVFWNRLGSVQEVSNSEIGPDIQLTSYKYSDWQEARFEPARFDNGLFVNHDIGEGWNNDGANFFAINTDGMGWSPDHGAIEFWFKFRYGADTRNHAYFFDTRNTFMNHYPDQNWTTGLNFAAGWNGWDYGSYGKRFFFGVSTPTQSVVAYTPDYSAYPGGSLAFVDGTLMHFAFVWDNAGIGGSADTLRIYVNGSVVGTASQHWPANQPIDPYLFIGTGPNCCAWDTAYNAVKGVTDNLIIWNYAKTNFSDRNREKPIIACRNILFAPPRLSDPGQYAGFVTVGDFNNDNKLDAAVLHGTPVLSPGNSSVSVQLGDGNGGFAAPTAYYPVDRGAIHMVTSDFNGDHHLDLAVANYESGNYLHPSYVSVLLGNGDGTFNAAVNYEVGYGPDSITVGDFNGDTKPDLAVANAGIGNQVSVLLGRGDGTFYPAVNYPSGVQPMAVVTADFNSDGKLDLVTANWGPSDDDGWLTLLLGNGDGTFPTRTYIEPPTIYSKPGSLVVGDFNRDNKPDLAVQDSFNGFVMVLLGQGDGTFTGSLSYQGSADVLEDFNGDGFPDLVGPYGDKVGLWLGRGDGTFRLTGPFQAGDRPGSMAAGDFNGDIRPDLVTLLSINDVGKLGVLFNTCALTTCLPMILR